MLGEVDAHVRNMSYGILEEGQHVDDLAQCAVGRQTAVIKQMVEAAEIITLACDRLSLVIDAGGGSRRAVARPRNVVEGLLLSDVTPRKRPVSTARTSGHAPVVVLHCAIHHARHRIARCGCRMSGVWLMCHVQYSHPFAL